MDQNQSKSSMKRTCEDNGGQQSNSQRIEPSDESLVDKTTKVTDVNDDCLVKIFGHLDLQSLFNVGVANEWLRPAANDVYKRKFGIDMVHISGCDDNRPKTRALQISENWLDVRGLKTSLQFLRCFGSSIEKLTITCNGSENKRYGFVHRYINDYCAKSLVRLSVGKMPNIAIEQFQTKFMNVDEIVFFMGNLAEQRSYFFKCFPNLRCLHIYQEAISSSTLFDSIKGHQSISDLIISTGVNEISTDSALVNRLISEHPALVTLDLFGCTFTANEVLALVHQLHSLKCLRFSMTRSEYISLSSKLKNDGEWLNVLCRQKSAQVFVELTRQA